MDRLWARFSIALALMVASFVGLRVIAVLHAPLPFRDTPTYLPLNFLGYDDRLWTVPLVWKLFPSPDLREFAQLGLGCLAWATLALSLAAVLDSRPVALIAAAGVLCLGLIGPVAGWDNILLSESLSTSLLVALIALLLVVWRRPTGRLIAAALAVATLWMFTRQDNVVIVLGLLPFLVGFTFWRRGRRSGLPLVAALVAIGLWGGFAITRSGDAPVVNWNSLQIIENRIVPHPAELRFFVARGLPVTPAVLAERGAFPGHTSPLFHDPRVMHWVRQDFRPAYLTYLVQHLPAAVGGAFAAIPPAVTGPTEALAQVRSVPPSLVVRVLWSSEAALAVELALAMGLGALCLALRRRVRALPVIGLLVLTVLAGTILTWNLSGYLTSGGDLPRLFLPVAVGLRLAILLAIAFCADAVVSQASTLRAHG